MTDRGYQCHSLSDSLQTEGKYFLCRIRNNTKTERIIEYDVKPGGCVFYDAVVLLGTPGVNQTGTPVRLVGYRVGNTEYLIATNRHDLTAEQIAFIYKLRWDIEKFFQWWKKNLSVYHLIARSEYGVMVQLLAGLITYLLMAIYCRKHHNETVSVVRLRQIRISMRNELRTSSCEIIDLLQNTLD
ncbi:IS4/IS5 family transposase [Desulfonema ishimotonii]|uniref:IS4/IS5 family transposase n=1 Tax=Desulfonema ishimotonii TaxID=45657 RepID=A0A401FZS9_9BACT|nr:transposase [Desulfonema ishimotonii]GBC62468.1 IS4/IS5 family transposase [Desulfonema ishimotonii]